MKIVGGALLDSIIVSLGNGQQAKKVATRAHFVQDGREVAEPCKNLFANVCVEFSNAFFKLHR